MYGRDLSAISTWLKLVYGIRAASSRGTSRFQTPGLTVPAVHEDDGKGIACHGIQMYLPIR
jgi:hypothetical protein